MDGLGRDVKRAWMVLRRDGAGAFMGQVRHRLRRALYRRRRGGPFGEAARVETSLGMISEEERAYLQWYAESEFSGEGVIVDLGCWFGSSTINLALGLERNERIADKGKLIHAYDIFLWEDWMEATVVGTGLSEHLKPGDSFLDEFLERSRPWEPLIEVHPGDLTELGWRPGRPIEFLFNDASKSWELAAAIVRDFYPSLIPGRTIVVEQDFAHFYTPWVHLIRHRFRDCFEPVSHIRFSGSAVFRQTDPIAPDRLAEPVEFAAFTEQQIEEAFEDSLRLVSPEMRPNVAAARVMLYVHAGDTDRARREYERAEREGLHGLDLIKVKKHHLE